MILHLLEKLSNPEKSRNFERFQNYSLDGFQSYLNQLSLYPNSSKHIRMGVIGTNGKGSVSYFLAEILEKLHPENLIGLYTSPHLISPFERIQINRVPIQESDADRLFPIKSIDPHLSYFEVMTAMAIQIFEDKNCHFQIYEAGLGGRLDATKLTEPEYVFLTKIGIDHSEILGNTETKILKEKLGFTNNNTKVLFALPQESEDLNQQIQNHCRENKIQLFIYDKSFHSDYLSYNESFVRWSLQILFPELKSKIESLSPLNPPPGRMEILRREPMLIYDTAHNPSAIRYALQSLKFKYPNIRFNVFMGCLKDKDRNGIDSEFMNQSNIDSITHISGEGFFPPSNELPSIHLDDLFDHLNANRENSFVCGSFRMYAKLKGKFHD